MLVRMWRKRNSFAQLVGLQTGTVIWKTVWKFLTKLKIELPYDPAIELLGIYPKNTKMLIWRGTCPPVFIAPMSTIAKLWKESQCPSTDEWIKKIKTMEYYSAMKKNEIMPFATMWTELMSIILSEISQSEKENTIWSHSYMEFKKQNMNIGKKRVKPRNRLLTI